MSYKWPDKDKDEVLDYSIDWSRFLGDDTISGVSWFVDDNQGTKTLIDAGEIVNNLQMVQKTNTLTVATIRLSLGTNNVRYRVTCKITTVEGLQYERSVFVRVKEK